MPWQDIGFTVGQAIMALTLAPTIWDSDSAVPRWTSVPTATVLFAFVALYGSLGFWLSAAVSAATAAAWTGVAVWRAP